MTAYSRLLRPPRVQKAPPPRALTPRQQAAVDAVIDAARSAPGALRLLNRADWIYTAQLRGDTVRWRIEDSYRNLIAAGECR